MSKVSIVTAWMILNLALTFIMPIHATFFTYPQRVYDAKRAEAEITKAEAVNNLDDVARYVENALRYLDSYSGNPCWWYPTVQTDWGRIKENLHSIFNSAKTLEADPSTFAYQQMLHNLEDELLELRDQINNTTDWITIHSPETLFFVVIWILLWVGWLIMVAVWG